MNTIVARHILTSDSYKFQLDKSGRIESVEKCSFEPQENYYCGPGLFDLQINGINGVDFNTVGFTFEDLILTTEFLKRGGVHKYLPTVITNSRENLKSILTKLDSFLDANELKHSIPGIHLEGPFISSLDGPRGAHPLENVEEPDLDYFEKLMKWSGNRIMILTMSPEYDNSFDFIEKVTKSGVKVSIGHTNATPEQIRKAIIAGASMSTHLGNATPMKMHRNDNLTLEQLASDKLYAGFIADGHHLKNSFLKLIIKQKEDKAILVSDGTQFTGMKPGKYKTLIGGEVNLNSKNRLSMVRQPELLAGSAVTLLDCVNHLYKSRLVSAEEAWKLASVNPANYLGTTNDKLVLFRLNKDNIEIVGY